MSSQSAAETPEGIRLASLHDSLQKTRAKMLACVQQLAALRVDEGRLEAEIRALLGQPADVPRKGRPPTTTHPFPAAVGNVTAWARENNLNPDHVKTWYADGKHGRMIPRQWAMILRRKFNIPLESWPKGIRG